ncbi:hypothetical protein KIN20_025015 [Parelaphostrongylus tenuis]|uniref:Uncharacterized protein n=1 Tax=Parelaphostrongylus tenuis TaxID=148309 RepID=A0AAD5MUF4_PARTN|nr:hypothetical protein KIN20_025015 [Parelaphostrongylus tenuis]
MEMLLVPTRVIRRLMGRKVIQQLRVRRQVATISSNSIIRLVIFYSTSLLVENYLTSAEWLKRGYLVLMSPNRKKQMPSLVNQDSGIVTGGSDVPSLLIWLHFPYLY